MNRSKNNNNGNFYSALPIKSLYAQGAYKSNTSNNMITHTRARARVRAHTHTHTRHHLRITCHQNTRTKRLKIKTLELHLLSLSLSPLSICTLSKTTFFVHLPSAQKKRSHFLCIPVVVRGFFKPGNVKEVRPTLTAVSNVEEMRPTLTAISNVEEVRPTLTAVSNVEEVRPTLTAVSNVEEVRPALTAVSNVEEERPTLTAVSKTSSHTTDIRRKYLVETSDQRLKCSTGRTPHVVNNGLTSVKGTSGL